MSVASICNEIEQLSEKVENLLKSEDEKTCPELLKRRQGLLEKLAIYARQGEMTQSDYFDFLKSIQVRDQKALNFITEQKIAIASAGAEHNKKKNALNMYNKFGK